MYPKISLYCIQVYFRPVDLTSCYTCEEFRPVLNSPRQSCVKNKGIRSVSNPPADNTGERSRNKTRANISMHTKMMTINTESPSFIQVTCFFLFLLSLFIYLFIYLYIYLYIYLFIYLYIYLYIFFTFFIFTFFI